MSSLSNKEGVSKGSQLGLSSLVLFSVLILLISTISALIPIEAEEPTDLSSRYSIIYYDISGKTNLELRQQMKQLGPRDHDGAACYGFTKWKLKWNWPEASSPDGGGKLYEFEQAKVDLHVTMTLPRWTDKELAPKTLQKEWEDFFFALKKHEEGHVVLAEDGAEVLRRKLRALGTQSHKKAAEKLTRTVLTRMRRADHHYDSKTVNGKSQGVFLR